MIRVPARSVSSEVSVLSLERATFLLCPHMVGRDRETASSLLSLLIRALTPS